MADVELDNLNEPHDREVREYLAATLDGQMGRAEARFRAVLQESSQRQTSPTPRASYRLPNRVRGWTMGLVGGAMAAGLGALLAAPSLRSLPMGGPGGSGQTPIIGSTSVPGPMLVQHDVASQTFDDGTIMADDDTPVRVLRRRELDRTRWYDGDDRLQGERVVPSDHLVYVKMKTY